MCTVGFKLSALSCSLRSRVRCSMARQDAPDHFSVKSFEMKAKACHPPASGAISQSWPCIVLCEMYLCAPPHSLVALQS